MPTIDGIEYFTGTEVAALIQKAIAQEEAKLAQKIIPLLADLDEAGAEYQEIIGEDGEGGTVKDYENYEDTRLAFADNAEHLLRTYLREGG